MEAKNLSIGVISDAPYANPCFTGGIFPTNGKILTGTCQAGFGVEMALLACEIMGLVCQFTVVNHTDYGTNLTPDGSWNGMIGQILNGEFDTSLPAFNPTKERNKVIQFSPTAYYDENILLTNSPTVESFGITTIPKVFGWEVWMTILISVVVLALIGACIQQKKSSKIPLQLVEIMSGNVSSNMDKAGGGNFSFPLLMLFWGFGSLLLASYFSSQIVASAIDSVVVRVIKNLDSFGNCLKSGGCQILTNQLSTSGFEKIHSAQPGDPFYRLKVGLEENPPKLMPLLEAADETLMQKNGGKKLAVLTYRFNGINVLNGNIERMCSFDIFPLGNMMIIAFPFRKHEPIARKFDDILFRLRRSGVSQKIYAKYFGTIYEKHRDCYKVDTHFKAMPIKAFFVGFALILANALLAGFVFLLETLVHRKCGNFGVKTDSNNFEEEKY